MSEYLQDDGAAIEHMSDDEIDSLITDEATPEVVREALLMALVSKAIAESFTGIID